MYSKSQLKAIEHIKARAEANAGRVEFTTQEGISFISTITEFTEFFDAREKDKSRIITRIMRKAILKFANDYPTDTPNAYYRSTTSSAWIAVYYGASAAERFYIPKRHKIEGISMWKRDGSKHLPYPDRKVKLTPLERLNAHWKIPTNHSVKERLFGFELEFCTDKTIVEERVKYKQGGCKQGCCPGDGPDIEEVITKQLPIPDFREIEFIVPGVQFKHDGSVKPCITKYAEATLLAGPNSLARLKALCREIKKRGGFVNKTCGMHVHLDARANDRRVAGIRASKLYDAIDILKDLVPDSRLKECQCKDKDLHPGINHYCRIEKPSFSNDRYTAINLSAYLKYNTIEVRLAAGSLNPTKIWQWANFLFHISNSKNRYTTWKELLESDFPLYLRIWAVNRADQLRPNSKLRLERMGMIDPGLGITFDEEFSTEKEVE